MAPSSTPSPSPEAETPIPGALESDDTQPSSTPAPSESNLVAHARRELRLIGEDPETIRGMCNVIQAFADMGHSGSSAHFATQYLERLLRYQPLSDLTDDPGEWIDRHADGMSPIPMWQSTRHPEAFSTDGGKTYTLLSERDATGDLVTTPLHRSKALDHAADPMDETEASS